MSKLKKALEKAKETRTAEPIPAPAAPRRSADLKSFPKINKTRLPTHGLEFRYTQTRVEPVDPETLKKNKIVSLFPDNELTDQINILRTQILAKLKEIGGNTLLVTSANPQEGKTFTAVNLGISITKQLDRTVLVVDTDLKTPTKSHRDFAADFFGINVRKGLADYLSGEAELPEIMINPGVDKLTIIPGGRAIPNSSELLGASQMALLIKDLKNRYRDDRIIIFDTSALLKSPDALVFSDLIDGILLVVEMERTTPDELKRTMEMLRDKPVIGTVMNKIKEKRAAHV